MIGGVEAVAIASGLFLFAAGMKGLYDRLTLPHEVEEVLHEVEVETIDERHDILWDELPPGDRQRVVAHLRGMLDTQDAAEIAEAYEADPRRWWVPYHFFAGMAVRNHLRSAIWDCDLPTRNWDDYWVRAVESAIGVKPV